MNSRIFISYRRDDSRKQSNLLYEFLCARFGEQHIFRDLDSINSGLDFVDVITQKLNSCAAVVVLIGKDWLDIRNRGGRRRLDDPKDFVRLEIVAALQRDIPVIPLLINNTPLPAAKKLPKEMRPIIQRQTTLLRNTQFETDAGFLAKRLEESLGFYHGRISPNISKGLEVLRKRIENANIPSSTTGKTLNLAAWNIRNLGQRPREKASLHYIAEILSQFDLIGISEVEKFYGDMRAIAKILGPFWQVLFSGGFAYVFDTRKVNFSGIARQVDGLSKLGRMKSEPVELPFLRNPYVVSFEHGDHELIFVLAHVRWGQKLDKRIKELRDFAKWFDIFRKREQGENRTLIALGQYQIHEMNDRFFQALTEHGLCVPKALGNIGGNNIRRNRYYQQILAYDEDTAIFTKHAGILDFYAEDFTPLYPDKKLNLNQFTFQLSDHLPLWVQLN